MSVITSDWNMRRMIAMRLMGEFMERGEKSVFQCARAVARITGLRPHSIKHAYGATLIFPDGEWVTKDLTETAYNSIK